MSLRTPLSQAKGLGSAKEGASHWWLQRLTAIALVPLAIWFALQLGLQVIVEDYVHGWLKVVTLIIINFLCIALAIVGIVALLKIFL